MTIYLDVVWILNFFLDMMLLLLTQALAKVNMRKLRIIFGGFIASLIVPITIYFPESFLTTVYGKLLYSIVIIFCTFGFRSIYLVIKLLLLFYFSTFSIGGGLFAAHFLLQSPVGFSANGLLTYSGGYGDPVSWIFVIIGFPIAWFFTKARMDKHAIEKIRYDQIYPVSISMKNKTFSTNGYIDSGNQLVDTITKRPVVICDEMFLKQWFTEKEWQMLKNAFDQFDLEMLPENWRECIHILPYHGVEGKSSFLLALRPNNITIYYNNKKIITTRILIGVQFASLTKDESYHCLLHPQIIKLAAVHSA